MFEHLVVTRYPYFLLLPLLLSRVHTPLAIVAVVALLILLRSPNRIDPIPTPPDSPLVSAADGVVMDVSTDVTSCQVSIFLSIWDVHAQYSPAGGYVVKREYKPGSFHPAYLLQKSQYNERLSTSILMDNGRIVTVVQIAGQIANRIDSFVTVGQPVRKGQQLGIILFGSRVDMIVPSTYYIPKVKKGQYVNAGSTPIFAKKINPM
jgi:phosphatidylserine decarboxylase